MLTIILPGYSEHNRQWAEDMKFKMALTGEVFVHNWKHWSSTSSDSSSGSFSLKQEIDSLLKEISNQKVNIIAKSVGVYVALNLIPKIYPQVNKVILCGIASVANEDRKSLVSAVINTLPVDNILCIQNENDKYITFNEAQKFYHSVETKLKIISKPRSDHEYPYPMDFKNFLGQ